MEYLRRTGGYADEERSPRPDLVLLDLNMPGMDGRDVLSEMRADEALKEIPVVVLTTSESPLDIASVYRLGCNSFITKPVDMEQFIRVVRELGSYWFELVTLP